MCDIKIVKYEFLYPLDVPNTHIKVINCCWSENMVSGFNDKINFIL